MKINTRFHLAPASMPLAPMIDIVFLLLIFFILTWKFARFETELDISVPAAEAGKDPKRTIGEIIVNLNTQGKIFVQGKQLTDKDLLDKLTKIAAVSPSQSVILRGDKSASYKDVMAVLDICQKAGIWNIAFATSLPQKEQQQLTE